MAVLLTDTLTRALTARWGCRGVFLQVIARWHGVLVRRHPSPTPTLLDRGQAQSVHVAIGVLALLVIAAAARRGVLGRRALAQRVVYQLVPTNSFDPSPEDVRRFAEQLRRSRACVSWLLPRRARTVRIRIATGADGRLVYLVEGHRDAAPVLRQQAYPEVEVRVVEQSDAVSDAASREGPERADADSICGLLRLGSRRGARVLRGRSDHVHVARAELVLAADAATPLRLVPLDPDPLQSLAAALADVNADLEECAEVCLDLLPLTAAQVAFLRRRHARRASGPAGWRRAAMDEVRSDWQGGRQRPPARRSVRQDQVSEKLAADEPVFAVQLLVRVRSEVQGRAQAHLHRILAAFDLWSGANRWRVRGAGVAAGPVVLAFFGADSVWRRRRFDRRFATGECRPPRRNLLTSGELAGLLKPPTRSCAYLNVVRSGGVVPPPPRQLPVYTGQPGVVPLGYAPALDGAERLLGAYLKDLAFSFRVGKSRYGKTEMALTQAAAIASGGGGVWFLDPHGDGWRRARPYLAHPSTRSRVWDVDLTVRGDQAMICSWNPLSMHGRGVADVDLVVDTVVTAVGAALSWGDSAPRATSILSKTCQTLCELGLRLPADTQPTLFQIRTLLDDQDWREAIVPHLPRDLQSYWAKAFPKMPGDSTPVITNLIERISASRTLRAFFGASESSYDVRRAMDTGRVVFVCPPGEGAVGRLVSCFLIFDVFRAGRSRGDVPVAQRRRFDVFVDELTAVDGSAKGYIASILEQLGKFGVWLHAMTQMAPRLTPATRDALLNNQTMLASSACELDAARLITKQWGRLVAPETVVDLPKYHHIVTTVVDGVRTTPFKVRGAEFTELFAHAHCPDLVPDLDRAVDESLRRRPIGQILAEQETLDARILDHLARSAVPPRGAEDLAVKPEEPPYTASIG